MLYTPPQFINVHGELIDLSTPLVMGILNLTPDSFYADSRQQTEQAIRERTRAILEEGGRIIDVGAYSSRPNAEHISTEEEMRRLRGGLSIIRKEAPDALVSVDTFRADVAQMCAEEFGVGIINDISAGQMDERMFSTVGKLRLPYILMHMQGTPQTMQACPQYEALLPEMLVYFSHHIHALREAGVQDIIIDPGFGFGKTLAHNYELMHHLKDFQVLELPLLVGVSRKSMIYRLLDSSPEEALNGTTVLHVLALQASAKILRVHDVRAAVETIRIYTATQDYTTLNA